MVPGSGQACLGENVVNAAGEFLLIGPGSNISSVLVGAPRVAWPAELVGVAEPAMRQEHAKAGGPKAPEIPLAAGQSRNTSRCA
jgi:hypothetical protein